MDEAGRWIAAAERQATQRTLAVDCVSVAEGTGIGDGPESISDWAAERDELPGE